MKFLTLCLMSFSLCSVTCLVAEDDSKPEGGETVEVTAQGLNLTVPKSWEQQQPSNRLRLAQFEIPSKDGNGDAGEVVVFPPFGGSKAANIQRWIDQFASEGRKVSAVEGESDQGQYVLVDLTGTYNKPVGPPIRGQKEAVAGYRMVSVIFSVEGKGNYFLKLVGPEELVTSELEAFRNSFGAKKATEKPFAF